MTDHANSIEHWASADRGLRGDELRAAAHEIRRLQTLIADRLELAALRKRVKRQRRELRILNKQLQAFWRGWYHHSAIAMQNDYRGKMIKAFGIMAVNGAENEIL